MAKRKIQNRSESRPDVSDFNPFSEETSNSSGAMQRLIETISDKTDSPSGKLERPSSTGAEGSIRAIKDKKDWYIEFKTADGWIRSDNTSASGFKLKK
jgi:hypothetical protein